MKVRFDFCVYMKVKFWFRMYSKCKLSFGFVCVNKILGFGFVRV
jgi:hypothetical protein